MTCDILVISCAKHFSWLVYCLRSAVRFASGFRQVLVLIPSTDLGELTSQLREFADNIGVPIRIKTYEDWPDKGFLAHEYIITASDLVSDADFMCHIDSDCLFVEPVTPEDYFVDGKPVLMHGSYHWLATDVQANLMMWQEGVVRAIGGEVTQETMRRHPAVHHRSVYAKTRECIQEHTGKNAADYIRSCDNAFPQGYCEFNTIGAVAWRHFHDHYHWIDHQQLHETNTPWPNNKMAQFWTHSPPEIAQAPKILNVPTTCTPDSLLKSL